MADSKMIPDKVHLVGSVGLNSVQEVLKTVGKTLGRRLRRIPDGEPGARRMWISFQYPLLRVNPFLKPDFNEPIAGLGWPKIALADGVSAEELQFTELNYAREARTSYQDFLAARNAGDIAKGVRFQVCLPTPLAVIYPFCAARDFEAIERAYEKAMLREAATICAAIPHKDLAIQWDVCMEMILWDSRFPAYTAPFKDLHGEILSRLGRVGDAIPRDVEMGIHLCYGDLDGRHFIEPEDLGKAVELANGIAHAVKRPINFMHMPVPVNRSDDAYFKPLQNLKLGPGTELYLGLVHADGKDKVDQRIAAASKYASDFGIATECGFGRARTPEIAIKILKAHEASSREPTQR